MLVGQKTGRATELNGASETEWQRQERDLSLSLFESILEEDPLEARLLPTALSVAFPFLSLRSLPLPQRFWLI
jgi:hypothetical protein